MFQRHQARECSGEPDHEQGDADRLRVGGLHPGELLHDLRRYTVHSQHIYSCILTCLLRLQYSALVNIKVWRLELGLKFIFT